MGEFSISYIDEKRKTQKKQKFVSLVFYSLATLALLCALKDDSAGMNKIWNTNSSQVGQISSPNAAAIEFASLLQQTEGFSKNFYLDNKGLAIAYGWNISRNDASFNRVVAKKMGLKKHDIKKIINFSNQKKPNKNLLLTIASIEVSPVDAQAANSFLYEFYITEFLKVFSSKYPSISKEDINTNFTDAQKAMFAHMAYKVGLTGLGQYNNFFEHLAQYIHDKKHNASIDKCSVSLALAQSEIGYIYTTRSGEVKRDEKVEQIHRKALGRVV